MAAQQLITGKLAEADKRLDSIDLRPVGSGSAELAAYVDSTGYGLKLNAESRISENVSAFASGWAGVVDLPSIGSVGDFGAMVGARVHW